jgi:hypothetical protein
MATGAILKSRSKVAMTQNFSAVIKIRGVNPFILVSAPRVSAIKSGWRNPLPILLRINGEPTKAWRTSMMPAGNGSFYLYLHGEMRKVSGTSVGDRVSVQIDFDASYRNGPQHPMQTWFKQALAASPEAKKNWRKLIPSRKKEILRYFSRLNSAGARARNLARALHVLSGGNGRFMGRAWEAGS